MLCSPSPWISYMRKPLWLCDSVVWGEQLCPKTLPNMPSTRTLFFLGKPAGNPPAYTIILHFIISKGCDYRLCFCEPVLVLQLAYLHPTGRCYTLHFTDSPQRPSCISSSLVLLATYSGSAKGDQIWQIRECQQENPPCWTQTGINTK